MFTEIFKFKMSLHLRISFEFNFVKLINIPSKEKPHASVIQQIQKKYLFKNILSHLFSEKKSE